MTPKRRPATKKDVAQPPSAVNESNALPSLTDLRPAPYNPRVLSETARAGLARSLSEFGNISGLVWNRRSGHLVCGHQRLDALRKEHGDGLTMQGGAVVTPDGETFPVRIVDWPEDRERAANLAANNAALAGDFTSAALDLVSDLENSLPDLVDGLLLRDIEIPGLDAIEDDIPDDQDGPPEMELQPFEHFDYLVVLCRDVRDWQFLTEKLGIRQVNSSPIAGKKKIGIGRAIPAERLIALLERVPDKSPQSHKPHRRKKGK